MKKKCLLMIVYSVVILFNSQAQTQGIDKGEIVDTLPQEKEKIPLEGFDLTWQNGNDRRDSAVLTSKYVVGNIMVDGGATYSFNNPIDNTVVGSTSMARNNEMQINCASFGGDFNYHGARARIYTQFGTRVTVVPRNDYSQYKGQYELANMYRNISEAYAGYHFNKWYGINVDAGLFMSYVGLLSNYQSENWSYQASYTSDNTPWFFNGIRVQIFPTKTFKMEGWIINGWQSYGKFNKMPGFGVNFTWSPKEYIKILTNDYYGTDAAGFANRIRFHSDNSFLLRYYNHKQSKGISRMAFTLTADLGFESGDGVTPFGGAGGPEQNFIAGMAYNRIWFNKNKFGWTIGGGFMHNPGRYLVLLPTGDASPLPNPNNPTQTLGTHPFSANVGDQFDAIDFSTSFDWMPNQSLTFRIEYVYREASTPYFAGHGGVTSPTGYITTPLPADWKPDLVKAESRITFVVIFRL